MLNDKKTLTGKRIGVFGKGGSGKSTLTVLRRYSRKQRLPFY